MQPRDDCHADAASCRTRGRAARRPATRPAPGFDFNICYNRCLQQGGSPVRVSRAARTGPRDRAHSARRTATAATTIPARRDYHDPAPRQGFTDRPAQRQSWSRRLEAEEETMRRFCAPRLRGSFASHRRRWRRATIPTASSRSSIRTSPAAPPTSSPARWRPGCRAGSASSSSWRTAPAPAARSAPPAWRAPTPTATRCCSRRRWCCRFIRRIAPTPATSRTRSFRYASRSSTRWRSRCGRTRRSRTIADLVAAAKAEARRAELRPSGRA